MNNEDNEIRTPLVAGYLKNIEECGDIPDER